MDDQALWEAAESGDVEAVKRMIGCITKYSQFYTLSQHAGKSGSVEMMTYVLSNGGIANGCLNGVLASRSSEALKWLVETYPDVELEDEYEDDYSFLMATFEANPKPEWVEALVLYLGLQPTATEMAFAVINDRDYLPFLVKHCGGINYDVMEKILSMSEHFNCIEDDLIDALDVAFEHGGNPNHVGDIGWLPPEVQEYLTTKFPDTFGE